MILWSDQWGVTLFSVDKNLLSTINMFWYVFLSIWHHIVRFFASDYIVLTRWPGLFFFKSQRRMGTIFHKKSVHHFSNKISFHKTKISYWKVDLNHVYSMFQMPGECIWNLRSLLGEAEVQHCLLGRPRWKDMCWWISKTCIDLITCMQFQSQNLFRRMSW